MIQTSRIFLVEKPCLVIFVNPGNDETFLFCSCKDVLYAVRGVCVNDISLLVNDDELMSLSEFNETMGVLQVQDSFDVSAWAVGRTGQHF
jgi:hypothetical protein